eukprot:scaffold228284_cov36-Tisochrysis_lutea.AAC.5
MGSPAFLLPRGRAGDMRSRAQPARRLRRPRASGTATPLLDPSSIVERACRVAEAGERGREREDEGDGATDRRGDARGGEEKSGARRSTIIAT